MKKSKLTDLLDWMHESKPQTIDEVKSKIIDMIYQEKKSKVTEVPKLREVITYFVLNGYSEDAAIKAFDYYSAGDWHDSRGKKIMNWKLKMKGVWFKDENKIQKKVVKPMPVVSDFFEYSDYQQALEKWEQTSGY